MINVLEVKNICKRYKDFELKDISFNLQRGTITGFIGENGSGKTTTMAAIMNLIKTDMGQVYMNGKEIKTTKERKRISYLESNRELYPDVSMSDYKYFVSHAYAHDWSEEKYNYYIKQFHIENVKKIKELSTGMKAKFFLAVELAKQPQILLLDEPTSGLDPIARNEVLEIIKSLAEDEERTIFFSSHITSDIEHTADKVIFIHNGKILLDMDKGKIAKYYKTIKMDNLTQINIMERNYIEKTSVRNFDYLIFEAQENRYDNNELYKNADLDDVLMFLTGGKQIV